MKLLLRYACRGQTDCPAKRTSSSTVDVECKCVWTGHRHPHTFDRGNETLSLPYYLHGNMVMKPPMIMIPPLPPWRVNRPTDKQIWMIGKVYNQIERSPSPERLATLCSLYVLQNLMQTECIGIVIVILQNLHLFVDALVIRPLMETLNHSIVLWIQM